MCVLKIHEGEMFVCKIEFYLEKKKVATMNMHSMFCHLML